MFQVNRCEKEPESLAKKKSYNEKDVVRQLFKDFLGKCYICETKDIDPIVEHFISHGDDDLLKYDWNNLFYACQHCNLMKKEKKFNRNILDCTKEDVVRTLEHKYDEFNKNIEIIPQKDDLKVKLTAELIHNTFAKDNTGAREISCESRVEKLLEEINTFQELLIAFRKNKNDTTRKAIIAMMSKETAYSAFKKWIILRNTDKYAEFLEHVDD